MCVNDINLSVTVQFEKCNAVSNIRVAEMINKLYNKKGINYFAIVRFPVGLNS
jgi:hypothetical protein